MQVDFLIEAEEDILSAHDWYESKRAGLGADFELCLEASLERIQLFPESCPIKYRNCRLGLISHFPYGVIYTISEKMIIVIAVFHLKRNPKSITSQISKRIKK